MKEEEPQVEGKRSLWWRLLEAAFVIFITIVFTYSLIHAGLLPDFELVALDAQMRFNLPLENSPVAIVQITDEDYKKFFNEQSPLQPAGVQRLIDSITKGNPKVIGVDIETDAPEFLNLKISPDWPSIVWAHSAKEIVQGKLLPLPVLGGQEPQPCSGLVNILPDRDRVIRHYHRVFEEKDLYDPEVCKETEAGGSELKKDERQCLANCPLPSFAWALLEAYLPPEDFKKFKASRSETEELAIRFAQFQKESPEQPDSHRVVFTMQEVLDIYENDSGENVSTLPQPFDNKIVLIGGAFKAARDEHFTPLGTMWGVEIIAQILETEMQGGGIPPPRWYIIALILFFEYLLLASIFHYFHGSILRPVAVSLLIISFMALLCSFLTFGSFMLWIYFIPILVIGLIRELYDLAQEGRKKRVGMVIDYIRGAFPAHTTPAKNLQPRSATLISQPEKETPSTSNPNTTSESVEPTFTLKANYAIASVLLVATLIVLSLIGSTKDKSVDKK